MNIFSCGGTSENIEKAFVEYRMHVHLQWENQEDFSTEFNVLFNSDGGKIKNMNV
jgi:hypothetical protein